MAARECTLNTAKAGFSLILGGYCPHSIQLALVYQRSIIFYNE